MSISLFSPNTVSVGVDSEVHAEQVARGLGLIVLDADEDSIVIHSEEGSCRVEALVDPTITKERVVVFLRHAFPFVEE